MTDRIIKRGDSDFKLSDTMPSGWGLVTTVKVNVYNLDGVKIVDDQLATVYAGDNTAEAVKAGTFEITLVTGNAVKSGDIIHVGSVATGFHELVVDDYSTSTKKISFTERLPEDIPAGAQVSGRGMEYTIDASIVAFDNIKSVSVEWLPDTDDVSCIGLWRVLDRDSRVNALQSHFSKRFEKYRDVIAENWTTFEDDAWIEIRMIFDLDGRDLDTVIVNRILEPLVLLKIALLCCDSNPGEYAMDIEQLTLRFNSMLDQIRKMRIWDDSNQDAKMDDEELQAAVQPGLARGL